MGRTALLPLIALVIAWTFAPPAAPTAHAGKRTPVVLVPGMIGTRLEEPDRGRVVWGNVRSAFLPRDGGASMALPLVGAPRTEPQAVAATVLLGMRLFGVFRYNAYRPIVRLMEANGYRCGDLRRPNPDETFFLYGYDWRRSTTDTVADLMRDLSRLREARGDDTLRVDLVCQSTANRICRYLVKYGAATLAEAEHGVARRSFPLAVEKMVLVGTANGGSLRTLRELLRGRHYAGFLGRRFLPEVMFTFRSAFEDLPVADGELFVDAHGAPLELDLFDVATWRRYQWSVYAPAVRRRLEKRRPGWLPDNEGLNGYLADSLDRARRLHRVLAAEAEGFDRPAIAMIQSDLTPTPSRGRIQQVDGDWHTSFGGDRGLEGPPWQAPGDGHATVTSQNHLSRQELDAITTPTLNVEGAHFQMILAPEAEKHLIDVLLDR